MYKTSAVSRHFDLMADFILPEIRQKKQDDTLEQEVHEEEVDIKK